MLVYHQDITAVYLCDGTPRLLPTKLPCCGIRLTFFLLFYCRQSRDGVVLYHHALTMVWKEGEEVWQKYMPSRTTRVGWGRQRRPLAWRRSSRKWGGPSSESILIRREVYCAA